MREPQAAVAILRTPGPEPAILLMRRAERAGDAWSGHWSLPGGRREPADADLLETALRELREECGIRLSRAQMREALPPAVARRRSGPFLLVAPFVFEIPGELPTTLDPEEAVGALWFPQRRLLDPMQHIFQRVAGVPGDVWFPAITLPGAPLWGFTYRLLADWLHVSPRSGEHSAFAVARSILDFLLSCGLALRSSWRAAAPASGDEAGPVQAAEVGGAIPADAVLQRFSGPGAHVPQVNRLEVTPARIRIHGLAFEEYRIDAVAA